MEGRGAAQPHFLALEVHVAHMALARLQGTVGGVQQVGTTAAVDVTVGDARSAFEVTVASARVRVRLSAAAEERHSLGAEVVLAMEVRTVHLVQAA